jgi:hypothetical protein
MDYLPTDSCNNPSLVGLALLSNADKQPLTWSITRENATYYSYKRQEWECCTLSAIYRHTKSNKSLLRVTYTSFSSQLVKWAK